MERICGEIPGNLMANMVEQGSTPVLPPDRLAELGYALAAYPLTLLSSAVRAMNEALAALGRGESPASLLGFDELRDTVGFTDYDVTSARYAMKD